MLYKHPFSKSYWRDAVSEFKNLKILVFSAMMIAACVALSYIPSIQVAEGVRVSWGFLARALCSMVGGPVNALVFGAAEDTISYFLHPTGPYFPGYMLTTMLGNLIYALFLYRADVTVVRVFLAKLLTNVLNVTLGALWSAILYGKAYLVVASASAVKNAIMLPVQAAMLCALFAALLPALGRLGLLPAQSGKRLTLWRPARKKP